MTTTSKKLHLSQQTIDDLVERLIKSIDASRRLFTVVVGIQNGGVHISQRVAEALGLPHKTVRISHYAGEKFRESPHVTVGDFEVFHHQSCLVVDDLVDGGHTIETFRTFFGLRPQDAVAVLFWNPAATYKPDFFVQEKPSAWIVFPWEED